MTLYIPYFIYIAISVLSLMTFLVVRRMGKNEKAVGNSTLLKLTIIIIVLYFLIKIILGWRLNWYIEAVVTLSIVVSFDYLIILRNKYSTNLQGIYYTLRLFSFGIPIIYTFGSFIIAVISLGYGRYFECVSIPTDRSYEEQQVYKNLYIYFDECRSEISFKKKFFFFEKDVASIYSNSAHEVYLRSQIDPNTAETPLTGYISYRNDTIIITSTKKMPKTRNHIRVVKLPENKMQIEYISPISYPPEPGEEVETESYKIKIITL